MNKIIASLFSTLFAILLIISVLTVIIMAMNSYRLGVYIFFGGFLLIAIFFGILAVFLDIRDEVIEIREILEKD